METVDTYILKEHLRDCLQSAPLQYGLPGTSMPSWLSFDDNKRREGINTEVKQICGGA